jgi:serine/threonine-protein kinase
MNELVGKKIGEYEIVEHVGHGVAADVYKAYQPKLNRHVAVKILSPVFVKEQAFLARFVREAQAVGQLDHPNILPVYDFDRQDDLVYIVMQYVNTGSLDDLTGQPLPLDFTLKILDQVGSALSHAHQRGIIHRDIKPGNILLGPDNWVLLTDFGLVKILETPAELTPSGMSLGTPAYMAPEQVAGDRVDQRADIYSLGATLYHMVTGRVPFEGGTGMAVAFKHLSEVLIPPRKFNPTLPPAVDKVIVKALSKEPDLRYQTVDELVSAFREAVERVKAPKSSASLPINTLLKPSTAQKEPTPPPQTSATVPFPLETIWPPVEATPARGGKGWALLGIIIGALVGFSLIFWSIATLLNKLL